MKRLLQIFAFFACFCLISTSGISQATLSIVDISADDTVLKVTETMNLSFSVMNSGDVEFEGAIFVNYSVNGTIVKQDDSITHNTLAPDAQTETLSYGVYIDPDIFKSSTTVFVIWPTGTSVEAGDSITIELTIDSLASIQSGYIVNMVKLFPNPAKALLYIDPLPNVAVPQAMSVLDIQGKEIFYQNTFSRMIDISALTQGFYMLRLEYKDMQPIVFKFNVVE